MVRPEFQIVDGPGEYEMEDVFVTGVRTFLDDAYTEKKQFNTAYLLEMDGFVICHLGDIGRSRIRSRPSSSPRQTSCCCRSAAETD